MTNDTFQVFFDGECPVCRREMAFVGRLDKHRRITMTDISLRGFEPPGDLTQADLMAHIHGRLADGTIVEGVEVFRQIYAAVGFGPLVAVTRIPPISWLLDVGYTVFARNRLRLTGRCTDATCAIEPKA